MESVGRARIQQNKGGDVKKLILLGVMLVVLFSFTSAFAEGKGYKGANQQAIENANENAIFNRVSDWFATIGKSPVDKARIKAERKAARAEKMAQKEAEKAKKEKKEKREKKEKKAKEAKELKKEHKLKKRAIKGGSAGAKE